MRVKNSLVATRFLSLTSFRATKTKISIPKENVERVGVRPLLTSDMLEACILEWGPDLKISKLHHKNRKSKFEIMRQTGNFEDMGMVVVTIHYLVKKAKATFEEKRMYDQIRKRLQDEIEIVKNWDKTRADAYLMNALDEAIERKPARTIEDVLDKGKSEADAFAEEETEEVFG